MKFTNPIKTAVALASVTVFAVCASAQDDDVDADKSAEKQPAAEQAAAVEGAEDISQVKTEDKFFYPLMRCKEIKGTVKIKLPRDRKLKDPGKTGRKNVYEDIATDVKEGHYYPLGSVVSIQGNGEEAPKAVFEFGDKSSVTLAPRLIDNADDKRGYAEFATTEVKLGERVRTVILKEGRVSLALPLKLKDGMFKVVTAKNTDSLSEIACENLTGESWFETFSEYSRGKNGEEVKTDVVVVHCKTGGITLKGPHYTFPKLLSANQLRITTTKRLSPAKEAEREKDKQTPVSWYDYYNVTALYGESGDCKVVLDQGLQAERNFETGEMVESAKTLDYSLSPQCSVKIIRAKSPVGGRTIVSTMTFNSLGEMKNRIAFAVNRSNVNSGELVVSTKVAEDDKNEAAKNKRQDEETEAVEVKVPAAKKEKEEKADDEEEKKDDKKEKSDDDLI